MSVRKAVTLSFLSLFSVGLARNWDYSFIALEQTIDKPDILDINLEMRRLVKRDYAVNGTITFKKEVGSSLQVSCKTYRSPRGNDDYKPMPFILPKLSAKDFINGVYKEILMNDVHRCSNAPYFEDEWNEIIKGTYTFNMCKLNFDNWPESVLPGFYKLVMDTFDDNDERVCSLGVILQIEFIGD
ncbi:hypothetical protein ACFFRR_001594 [Megaselia abdita]